MMPSDKTHQLSEENLTVPSLEGIMAKLARAMHHISEYEEARKKWRASIVANPPITIQENPSPPQPTFVLTSPKVDPEISPIIGDCVHNLRTCLDHLIGQLAIKEGHDIAKRSPLAFPVCTDKSAYDNFVQTKISPFIKNLEVLQAINAIQPYHRHEPKTDPLWVLSELDNLDKHRKLVVASPHLISRGMQGSVGPWENVKEETYDPVADKDLILFQIELWPHPYASAKEAGEKARTFVLRADAKLVLANTGLPCDRWSVQKSLRLMFDRVRKAVENLSHFL
ncbi:MAG: hypothetical protein HGA33_02400 [Candidatus Moranbacteria bacterium]|nr:hypothetical protein [Candidatus Moranbacteria bacterium]